MPALVGPPNCRTLPVPAGGTAPISLTPQGPPCRPFTMGPPGQAPHEYGFAMNPSLATYAWSFGLQHVASRVTGPMALSVQSTTPLAIRWIPRTVGVATLMPAPRIAWNPSVA